MRTTVPQRQLSYWHRILCRPNTETTTKMSTSQVTFLMTDCCLRGTNTHTLKICHKLQHLALLWVKVIILLLTVGGLTSVLSHQILQNMSHSLFGVFCHFHPTWKSLCVYVFVCRVLEQHKLTKEQWEDRIQTWHEEHRGMLRCVRLFLSHSPFKTHWETKNIYIMWVFELAH